VGGTFKFAKFAAPLVDGDDAGLGLELGFNALVFVLASDLTTQPEEICRQNDDARGRTRTCDPWLKTEPNGAVPVHTDDSRLVMLRLAIASE
jgi:hypothetical protein